MVTNELLILILTAASLGFIHAIAGPDHYVPFIAISRARNWSYYKTLGIVILCGTGHILSSIIISIGGIAIGLAISSINTIELARGHIAGWLLISFGLIYTVWGIRNSIKNKTHSHFHEHSDGSIHSHQHTHFKEHTHIHFAEKKNITPWILFIVFIFGPCESLIPLLLYPAASGNYFEVFVVSIVFGIITIFTMVLMTFLGLFGIKLLPTEKLEKNIHAIAGVTILLCGISVKFLGL